MVAAGRRASRSCSCRRQRPRRHIHSPSTTGCPVALIVTSPTGISCCLNRTGSENAPMNTRITIGTTVQATSSGELWVKRRRLRVGLAVVADASRRSAAPSRRCDHRDDDQQHVVQPVQVARQFGGRGLKAHRAVHRAPDDLKRPAPWRPPLPCGRQVPAAKADQCRSVTHVSFPVPVAALAAAVRIRAAACARIPLFLRP